MCSLYVVCYVWLIWFGFWVLSVFMRGVQVLFHLPLAVGRGRLPAIIPALCAGGIPSRTFYFVHGGGEQPIYLFVVAFL